MKRRHLMTLMTLAVFLGALCYGVVGNPQVWLNNRRLTRSMQAIHTDTVRINEVVPFAWDKVYNLTQNPGPYAGREDIEALIGFRSHDIQPNQINEGMVHLLFVKGDKVVACVLGYPENLGYGLAFGSSLESKENAWFRVSREQGVTWLTYGL